MLAWQTRAGSSSIWTRIRPASDGRVPEPCRLPDEVAVAVPRATASSSCRRFAEEQHPPHPSAYAGTLCPAAVLSCVAVVSHGREKRGRRYGRGREAALRRQRLQAHASQPADSPFLRRRGLILAAGSAGVTLPEVAGARGSEADIQYPFWPALPLAPYSRRRSVFNEVVPGQVWTVDQVFGTFYVYVPIRTTILKVTGGLLVYAPVAATTEFLNMVRGLEAAHGPVRWIVLPSKALEHKITVGPFARQFPAAELYIAPGQFAVPVDIPLALIGFPDYKVIDPTNLAALPWSSDCDTAAIDISTFGEVALFHRSSRTLLLVDTLASIPEDPPELLLDPDYKKALLYHARDDGAALEATPEVLRKGWARIALFACFFNPGGLMDGDTVVPEANATRPWAWQAGWQESFSRLRNNGRAFVAPIIRELILNQEPETTGAYIQRLSSWPLERVVPAHFSSPIPLTSQQLVNSYGFTEPEQVPSYCEEDLALLRDIQRSAIPDGTPVRGASRCGFASR